MLALQLTHTHRHRHIHKHTARYTSPAVCVHFIHSVYITQVYISVNNIHPINIQADWSWQHIYHNINFTYKPPNVPSPHFPTLWQLGQDRLRSVDKARRYVRSRVIRMSRSESIRRSGYFSRYTRIHGTNYYECHLLQTHKHAACLTINLLRNMFNKWGSP